MSETFAEEQLEALWNKVQSRGISRREFLQLLAGGAITAMVAACAPTEIPTPEPESPLDTSMPSQTETPAVLSTQTAKSLGVPKPAIYSKLPRWRGFNLFEKFVYNPRGNDPYNEWDLDFMAEWGFDFIRLPLDYRIWTASPGEYIEQPLKEIDQVVAWARARGIHVNLCLHRAPGNCVGTPKEPLDLWDDGSSGEEARREFADQWRMFAARYRGIPPAELSFNLVNEPPNITGEQYVLGVSSAIAAIREEDPNRLVLADGLSYGGQPVPELVPLQVAQSTRGYEPRLITHYRADWEAGSDQWPVPTWPFLVVINQFLYGQFKSELKSPLILKGSFPDVAQLSVRVQQVSGIAELLFKANGATIFQKMFKPGPGQGEWKESNYRKEYNDYLAIYDKEYSAALPARTSEIRIEVGQGDWLTFSEIRIKPFPGAPANELVIQLGDTQWGQRQETYLVDAQGKLSSVSGRASCNRETLWSNYVNPWKTFSDRYGIGVHIGEWGSFNQTPHAVVLTWMKDCLENWSRAEMGWALWNLRGSFGVLDSERSDVAYEDYQGHKLDGQMLELLRQY